MSGSKSYEDIIKEAFAKALSPVPPQVVYAEGRVEVPLPSFNAPQTRPTPVFLRELADQFITAYLGNDPAELTKIGRAVCNLALIRAGITPTEGINQSLPTNAKQLPAAARALGETAQFYGQVSALVDPADLAEIPGDLGQIALRKKMRDDAKEHLDALDRGLTASYHRLDMRVRKYLPVLKPLSSYAGIGVALQPFFALTQEPADKAQETLRDRQEARQEGRAEGRVEGREEALAESRKAAKKAGPQLNVGVVTPPEEPDGPAPVTPPQGRTRQRSR